MVDGKGNLGLVNAAVHAEANNPAELEVKKKPRLQGERLRKATATSALHGFSVVEGGDDDGDDNADDSARGEEVTLWY